MAGCQTSVTVPDFLFPFLFLLPSSPLFHCVVISFISYYITSKLDVVVLTNIQNVYAAFQRVKMSPLSSFGFLAQGTGKYCPPSACSSGFIRDYTQKLRILLLFCCTCGG